MRITPDTNVLLRIVTGDDLIQNAAALRAMESAEVVAIGRTCLCELVWVLKSRYSASRRDIANAVHSLIDGDKVVVDRLAVEGGLRLLESGGDFADGVIAHEGASLGGQTFVSFDRTAVKLILSEGRAAELLR